MRLFVGRVLPDIVLEERTQREFGLSGIWAAYRGMYDQVEATGADPILRQQLFEVGAAIADKDFPLAIDLTEQLREQTKSESTPSLGWAPTMWADELLRQLRELDI